MVYMLFFIDVGLGPVVENSLFCTHGRSSYFKLLCSIKFSTKSIQTKINKKYDTMNYNKKEYFFKILTITENIHCHVDKILINFFYQT